MKRFRLCLFSSLVLFLIIPGLGIADEKHAGEEVKQPETPQQVIPVVPDNTIISAPRTLSISSPVISPYDANTAASRAVDRNVGFFSTRIKQRFSLWLSRSGQYMELMKDILREKDVPEDIVFLSLIESGFNPYAYSIARASGPWQFIASTAKRYGLQINWWKDERRDPVKSTAAAASYLKDLYGMFGSWNLAMAAYNAGEGRIQKALKRSNADDYWALLATKHIRDETKDYVPKFIAASMIATNPGDFGFENIEYHQPMRYDEVELDSPLDLTVAAECAGVDLDVIKKLNPELRRWCTPPDAETYRLRIPEGSKEAFMNKLSSMKDEDRFSIDRYTVKKGDTLKKMARKTGVPESAILSLNSMDKILPLKVGSVIYLPPSGLFIQDADDKVALKKQIVKKVSLKVKGRKKKSSRKPKTTLAKRSVERSSMKG